MRIGGVCIAFACAVAISGCGQINPIHPPTHPPAPAPQLPPSKINASLKTSWRALQAAADAALARCSGSYPVCQGTEQSGNFILQREDAWEVVGSIGGRDIGFKGSAWRWDPVSLTLSNSRISAQTRVLYHAKIGFTQFGGFASCGYGQPAREMYVGLSGDIAIQSDWYVDARLAPNVTPGNLCQLTLFNINVTSHDARLANQALQKFADKANDAIRTGTNVRPKAASVWQTLQDPIPLGENIWLTINPTAASAGQLALTDGGQNLSLPVSIEASPRIVAGPKPIVIPTPLPPLSSGTIAPDFSLNVQAFLSNAEASRRLSELFVGRYYQLGQKWPASTLYAQISAVEFSTNGTEAVVAVSVEGATKGTLYLVGTPRFITDNNKRSKIVIENLDYTVETKNVLVKLGDWLLHGRLKAQLQRAANWDVTEKLQQARAGLLNALNRDLSPEVRLRGTIKKTGPGKIWIASDGLYALYTVNGTLDVIVDPPLRSSARMARR